MIQPKYLYIVPKDVAQANIHRLNANWIDLPNGKVLLSAEFNDEPHQDDFHRTASAEPVAHDGELVSEEHVQQLAHLGVKIGHTHKQIRALAKKIHGLM